MEERKRTVKRLFDFINREQRSVKSAVGWSAAGGGSING
jgi:hypothetical protein